MQDTQKLTLCCNSTGFCIAAIIATLLNATLPLDTDAEELEHLNGDHRSVDASL
jgi:hypothetical protein